MLPLLIGLLSPALAGAAVVGLTGGVDFSTSNPWAGVELALHPTHTQGVAPVLRLAPGWAFIDGQPLVLGELGFMARVPEDEAVVRVGLVGRVLFTGAKHDLPLGVFEAESARYGLIPGAMAALEFEWGDGRFPFTFSTGARAGVGSAVYDAACEEDSDRPDCLNWSASFIGGFLGRIRTDTGLSVEVVLGPTTHLSVGWAL